jgi:hypothetical protein
MAARMQVQPAELDFTTTSPGAAMIGNISETRSSAPSTALAPPLLCREGRACAIAIVVGAAVAACVVTSLPPASLPTLFFVEQDLVCLAASALLLLAMPLVRSPSFVAAWAAALERRAGCVALALAVLAVAVAAAGTYAVFRGFALSRDEIMAEFDATILRSGRLVASVPLEWRDLRRALVPEFLVPVPGAAVWMSNYLPGNAALRALVGLVVDPGLTSPLLVGVAILALYGVARRLWPSRPDAVVVGLVLLASSSQLLVTGMTAYAMTAHLALNMVWLWLFLRDDRLGHAGALGVGFLACGLHQVVFHPLFVAPFILRLMTQRRIRLSLTYVLAYAAIGVFWIAYWRLVLEDAGISQSDATQVGAQWFLHRGLQMFMDFRPDAVGLMVINGLRFVAWQHVLLVPLAFAAACAVRDDVGIARPLAAGIALTLAAMLVLMPYQGHGWGYRYLHGLLGNVCILAGYGWITVTAGAGQSVRAVARAVVGLATVFALLVMLPIHVIQAERFMAPYRNAHAAIERAPTDLVLVDRSGLMFAADLVRNDPFLRNRPKVLDLGFLEDAQLRDLCSRFTVSVFGRAQAIAFGIRENRRLPVGDENFWASRRDVLASLGCGTDLAVREGTGAPR